MTVRNGRPTVIEEWNGYNAFDDPQSLGPEYWPDSLNVVANSNGNASALRSPHGFNSQLTNSAPILSGAYYDRAAGDEIVFDVMESGTVSTYVTDSAGVNTRIRTGQAANARWQGVNVNDRHFRVNGTEFVQVVSANTVYAVGITKPVAAPTLSFPGGAAGTLTVGVSVSYAYRNSTTGHVGEASAVSANSGPATSGPALRVAVVASTQTGVDGLVLFISEDAGSIRYLYTDSNGDPMVYANTTANIDITDTLLTVGGGNFNFNVEETVFNVPPPTGITFIGRWKNRLIGVLGRTLYYSGFDQIQYGVPWECWPPLNQIIIPNKGEHAMGGADTPVGWLTLSDRDAYLITGEPTDKVDSGENTIQITESLDQLSWGIGTRSPLTIKNTPYGTTWLDQNKRQQMWSWEGRPQAIALGIWPDLATILDTAAIRAKVEGEWVASDGSNGGFYVLTGCTSGSTNNRTWFVQIIQKPDGLHVMPAPSTIPAQCVFTALMAGRHRCFIGGTDQLKEILDFDTAGDGWPDGTQIYFEMMTNNDAIYSTLYSVRLDGSGVQKMKWQVRDYRGKGIADVPHTLLTFKKREGSYCAFINAYGTRQKLRFQMATDDAAKQEIFNVHLVTAAKQRVI